MTVRLPDPGRRIHVVALALLLASCAAPPASSDGAASGASAPGAAGSASPVSLAIEVPPVPGPVKPFRGEASQQVYIRDGLVSMYFELRNVGEEPITWLNTLYDYEPQQLYTPVVQLEWQEGGRAVYTRAGRFFPSPAIIQPGDAAVYVMGGQPVQGAGTPGDLLTHIKYCPTRGMDDVPGIPVPVEEVTWQSNADGTVTARGTLVESAGSLRRRPPQVGVAFFDAQDRFIGAVVSPSDGQPLEPNQRRAFSISGAGVSGEAIATARAWALIP
ncbi:MAG: hypothetical protein ABI622_01060 [Chloroflexota bacterium]